MEIRTFFDFCSGIGGGRLGLEQLGLKCVGHSDTSRLADRTYQLMHGTEDKNYGNLKKLGKDNLPDFDLLIAGFPCQTFSVIGRQEGFSDDRGQIIFQLSRIIKEKRPKCFILENVKGLVTHDSGKTIKTIINELRSCGYTVSYRVLTSLNYGVPQMRQRVYFIGFNNEITDDYSSFLWPIEESSPSLSNYLIDNHLIDSAREDILKYYLKNPTNKGKYSIDDIRLMEGKIIDTRMNDLRIYTGKCPTLRAQRDGVLYVRNGKIYQLTGYEALLLQGFPKEKADKVKDVVSDRHLLMQAGNAMTVNVIYKLGQSIINFLKDKESSNMSTWETFEAESVEFLNNNYSDLATFQLQGGADSTTPDILVKTKNGKSFFVEAKHCPAQCGQFVLLPNVVTRKFDYSPRNANLINDAAVQIMNYMNDDFDNFREAGTAGKDIDMDQSVFFSWVIQNYKNKGVKYFISNNFTLITIDDIANYFEISAKYRIKRSGSSAVGNARIRLVVDYIQNHYPNVHDIQIEADKVFVLSANNIHNQRFVLNGYEYMFSQRGVRYEVRKLSNTYNANVIFSIDFKGNTQSAINEFTGDLHY